MWALMKDALLAGLLGAAVIPFVWMLSSGWKEADMFKRALRTYLEDHGKRDG